MSDSDFLKSCALVFLAFLVVILLSGCGGSEEPPDQPNTTQPVTCAPKCAI